jgi:hypothetical protein
LQRQTEENLTAGASELRRLMGLADAIEAMLPTVDAFRDWRAAANALAAETDLESPAGERALDELAFALRERWLALAHETTRGYLMAPPHEQPKFMPSGTKFQFDYERSSRPELLERRGLAGQPPPAGWRGACRLFSSGMSAISALVHVCCARLHGPMPEKPVQLDMFGGYFETWRLLDTVHDAVMRVEYLKSTEQLNERVAAGETDVLVLEPVAYDWDMTVFDLDAFAAAWHSAGADHPKLVIVDTSLTGHAFGFGELAPAFGDSPPWTVVFVRSGLKLDQEGLELSNAGVAHVYVPESGSPVHLERLLERLNVYRSVTGGGLTVNQQAALEAPWFLDRDRFRDHAGRVFANNTALARAIRLQGGVFSRVNHPRLSAMAGLPWAVAPFVVLHLTEDNAGRLGKLVAIVAHEARERGLQLDLGSSFGFRGHRFEVIRPLVQIREHGDSAGLLKIAMGARSGPSATAIAELLNEIAAYPDWQALADAYDGVAAYAKGSFGVYEPVPPKPGQIGG